MLFASSFPTCPSTALPSHFQLKEVLPDPSETLSQAALGTVSPTARCLCVWVTPDPLASCPVLAEIVGTVCTAIVLEVNKSSPLL